MTSRSFSRDLIAIAFAGFASLALWSVSLAPSPGLPETGPVSELEGLIDAGEAREAASFWLDHLDHGGFRPKLSYAPEHQRLVWRAATEHEVVVLDAASGELIELEFESE